ncbi:MAG: dockerin type I repeat-containing protein [Ruminococcus sp.]|nr:dockerin type I repeat-containing protein [Ruminococcus sp.]
MGKRIISIFLAAVLLLSVFTALPIAAGAADTDAAGTGDVISYFEVIDLDEPVPGQTPDYTVSVPAGVHYTVGYVEWREKDESAGLDPVFTNGTFKSGNIYTAYIYLNANSGYEFADRETATGTINGKEATVSSYGNKVWVERTYTCFFKITSVSVNLDEPVPGQEPDETVSVPAGANYYEDQVLFPEWNLIENGSVVNCAWETFEGGKTYQVVLYLHTYPGYVFGDDGENVTATINGKPATVNGDGSRIWVECVYVCPIGIIDSVSVLDLTEPVAGQTPDYTVSVPAGANYKPSEIEPPEWYHYENGDWHDKLSYNEPFESGKSYLFRIYMRSNSGYEFGDDGENVTAAINGKSATVGGWGQRIYVERTYTCTANFLSGTVTSFLDSSDKVTLRLDSVTSGGFYKLVDKAVLDGNSAAYQFGGLEKNVKYRLTVSKKNHVTRQYEFKLLFTDSKTQDVKICPIGDATNDGKVNMFDYNAVYKHVAKNPELAEGSYQRACADVTGDGKVNMFDYNAIYKHVTRTKPLWTVG